MQHACTVCIICKYGMGVSCHCACALLLMNPHLREGLIAALPHAVLVPLHTCFCL